MQLNKQSFFNLALRGLSMGARFLLIFVLGKHFSTEDLGLYGLFYTTVTLSLFLLGLDFYTYANREILYVKKEERLSVLRNQLVFYGTTYLIFLLPLLLIFYYNVLPVKYIYVFYTILVLEHLSQEFYRLFTVLAMPVFANWLLFLRTAVWIYILIIYYLFSANITYSLNLIFIGWILGAGISVAAGFTKILIMYKGQALIPMQLKWFKAGIKISALYFCSTIALKLIEFANRYMIEYWCDLKSVGIFTFYSQLANMINVVIFTLFTMIMFPSLITAVNETNKSDYLAIRQNMMKKTIIYSLILALALILCIHPFLAFINKAEYNAELNTFYILVLSNVFLNIALVYHYLLYALKKDMALLISTVICACISLAFNIGLIKHLGIKGASIALASSYLVLILIKAWYSKKAEAVLLKK